MSASKAIGLLVLAVVLIPPAAPAATIVTVAGTGSAGFSGDGGAATAAQVSSPIAVAAALDGGFLIADFANHRVRRVFPNGTITTLAGTGLAGSSGDGGPATAAQLTTPRGVAATADGGLLIADRDDNRIRKVFADGTITTVAGTGLAGYSGDGGPATAAQLNGPYGAAPIADGGFLIADRRNHAIRRVLPDGSITTVAGTGVAGFLGDGGPATAAQVNAPCAVAPASDGGFLIPDRDNHRVRRVFADGTIATVAGTGTAGSSGDGAPAAAAQLHSPYAVAFAGDGGFLVAERDGHRIRRVAPDGTITTVAGTGTAGFSGDGGPAAAAQLTSPIGLASTAEGGFLIADIGNHRIRLVDDGTQPGPAADLAPASPGAAETREPAALAFEPPGVPRLVVRIARNRFRARRGSRIEVAYTATSAAAVTLDLRARGTRVARFRRRATAGRNRIGFRVRRPGLYVLRLSAAGNDGQLARDHARLRVRG